MKMQYVNLLGSFGQATDLDSFVTAFFPAMGISKYEERESGSYVDGRYFKGASEHLTVIVSISDESDHEDLPFWVQVSGDVPDVAGLISEVDRTIRSQVIPAGFQFARMTNFGRRDEVRIDY